MITFESWGSHSPTGKRECFHRSCADDGAYSFDHIVNHAKRGKCIVEGNTITDTVPTYCGRDLETKEPLYVWQRIIFGSMSEQLPLFSEAAE